MLKSATIGAINFLPVDSGPRGRVESTFPVPDVPPDQRTSDAAGYTTGYDVH